MKQRKRPQNKKSTGFALDPALVAEVKAIAKEDERSASYIATLALREYVERRRKRTAA